MPACLMLLRVLDRLLVGGENGEAFETKPEARPIAFLRHGVGPFRS